MSKYGKKLNKEGKDVKKEIRKRENEHAFVD